MRKTKVRTLDDVLNPDRPQTSARDEFMNLNWRDLPAYQRAARAARRQALRDKAEEEDRARRAELEFQRIVRLAEEARTAKEREEEQAAKARREAKKRQKEDAEYARELLEEERRLQLAEAQRRQLAEAAQRWIEDVASRREEKRARNLHAHFTPPRPQSVPEAETRPSDVEEEREATQLEPASATVEPVTPQRSTPSYRCPSPTRSLTPGEPVTPERSPPRATSTPMQVIATPTQAVATPADSPMAVDTPVQQIYSWSPAGSPMDVDSPSFNRPYPPPQGTPIPPRRHGPSRLRESFLADGLHFGAAAPAKAVDSDSSSSADDDSTDDYLSLDESISESVHSRARGWRHTRKSVRHLSSWWSSWTDPVARQRRLRLWMRSLVLVTLSCAIFWAIWHWRDAVTAFVVTWTSYRHLLTYLVLGSAYSFHRIRGQRCLHGPQDGAHWYCRACNTCHELFNPECGYVEHIIRFQEELANRGTEDDHWSSALSEAKRKRYEAKLRRKAKREAEEERRARERVRGLINEPIDFTEPQDPIDYVSDRLGRALVLAVRWTFRGGSVAGVLWLLWAYVLPARECVCPMLDVDCVAQNVTIDR